MTILLIIAVGLLAGFVLMFWENGRDLAAANRELLAERTNIWHELTQLQAQNEALRANIEILAPSPIRETRSGHQWSVAPKFDPKNPTQTNYEPTSESAIDHG